MSKTTIPYARHYDGTKMQVIGLGTYKSMAGDCQTAVRDAIYAGYRHIDCAYLYENEREVGAAVRNAITDGIIKREDIFITSKLWCHFHEPMRVEYACRKSLANFGLEYMDVYLMHWPFSYKYRGDDEMTPLTADGQVEMTDVDFMETWGAMEKLVELGLTKSIGVSNFNLKQLTRLLDNCKIKPIHNQIECHPALHQKKLIAFCKENDIVVTGFCPLGRPDPIKRKPDFIFDDKVKAVADKHRKTPAQIVIRYMIDIGVVPLPKSVTKTRIIENINVFDFALDAHDVKVMESYNTNERIASALRAKNNINYPFGDE